jgi:tyrosinase
MSAASIVKSALVALVFLPLSALAAPAATSTATCTDPTVRSEWSSVSQDVRDAYIAAVNCLATKPSRIGLNTTLYDDFPWVHNALNLESESANPPSVTDPINTS